MWECSESSRMWDSIVNLVISNSVWKRPKPVLCRFQCEDSDHGTSYIVASDTQVETWNDEGEVVRFSIMMIRNV